MAQKKSSPGWEGLTLILLVLLISGCFRIPEENWLVSHRNTVEPKKQFTECTDNCLNRNQAESFAPGQATADMEKRHEELNADGFTLVSWNVYKGQKEGWAEDFERFSRETDLFILQEVYLTEDLRAMLNQANYQWDMTAAFEYRRIVSGVLTAARTKPTYTSMLREREPIIRIPKSVLISRYPLSGTDRELLVANIHGINFTIDHAAFKNQIDRMETILAEHLGPMIVSGDFNTWSAVRIFHVNAMVDRLGLSAVNFEENNRSRFIGHDIDHIYFRGLEANHAEVPIVSTSDHNPLTVTFTLDTTTDEKN